MGRPKLTKQEIIEQVESLGLKFIDFINCDGIQHFQPLPHFGGYERYIDLRVKDSIKNEYCKEHNINLIRIGYFNFDNIESLLKSKLNLNE